MKQILLLLGAKLKHIITRLGQDSVERQEDPTKQVKLSDEYFWFGRPVIVLDLLHFTLFQNSFEIAFFFWIWVSFYTINFLSKSKQISVPYASFTLRKESIYRSLKIQARPNSIRKASLGVRITPLYKDYFGFISN